MKRQDIISIALLVLGLILSVIFYVVFGVEVVKLAVKILQCIWTGPVLFVILIVLMIRIGRFGQK